MSQRMACLLEVALHLSESERGELAARLIESLEGVGEDDDAEFAANWAEEIARRLAYLGPSQVQTIPWSEARRMVHDESEPDVAR
jgi:hypothetical protein